MEEGEGEEVEEVEVEEVGGGEWREALRGMMPVSLGDRLTTPVGEDMRREG